MCILLTYPSMFELTLVQKCNDVHLEYALKLFVIISCPQWYMLCSLDELTYRFPASKWYQNVNRTNLDYGSSINAFHQMISQSYFGMKTSLDIAEKIDEISR